MTKSDLERIISVIRNCHK